MPDALPLTGLFGKVPAHGDFVRRGLPTSFVGPWDAWLQDGMATARERLGDRWAAQWDGAPPWRFALPAGACGPDAVAGVLLPSEDMVGRRFPITLAVLLPSGAPVPAPSWFAVLEVAALAGRAGQADADALAAAIPLPGSEPPEAMPALNWMPAETPDDATGDVLGMFGSDWAPAARPTHTLAPAEPADEAPDVLGVFSEDRAPTVHATAPEDETRRAKDLSGLMGEDPAPLGHVPTPPSMPDQAPVPAGGVTADVFGAEAPAARPDASGSPAPADDVLDFFSRPTAAAGALPADWSPSATDSIDTAPEPPTMATPVAPEPSSMDGTLAFLLGEATPAGAAPQPVGEHDDPLSVLMAAGGSEAHAAPEGHAPASPPYASIPAAFDPLPAAAPQLLPPAAAPEPPPGGGWWTGGGGRLPPSVRAQPALIPATAFASLLEADA